MAKGGISAQEQARRLLEEIHRGEFRPVYLLMGEEPYYPDLVCDEIVRCCISEDEKDFNETVCYGSDTSEENIISAARRYPMMAERQLVVVKEAQLLKKIETLALYAEKPLESTVLVILMHGAGADKRKSLYKTVQKTGVVLDSPVMRDYEIPGWIGSYCSSQGIQIDPAAAALLSESAGTSLGTIVVELDKMLKNLPEGVGRITVEDVEKNVGISREYSIFELTRELSSRNAGKAVKIASGIGNGAKFFMPMATSALFTHFYRILKYHALKSKGGIPSPEDKARALSGVNPYFYREYDEAVRNYSLKSTMSILSLLCDYDFKGKGGDIGPETTPAQLLIELVTKILNS